MPGALLVLLTAGVAVPFVEHDEAAGGEVGADVLEDGGCGCVEVAVDVYESDGAGWGPVGEGVGVEADDELGVDVGDVAGEPAGTEPWSPVFGESVERVEPDGGHGGCDEPEGAAGCDAEL